jgi:hypothetical protein
MRLSHFLATPMAAELMSTAKVRPRLGLSFEAGRNRGACPNHWVIAAVVVLLTAGAPHASVAQVTPPPHEGVPTGGVQLDMVPWRAQVYVDGYYVGRVEEFRGYYHHLALPAGLHVIEILAPSFEPLSFEVNVSPGRTTTYRGNLSRAPGH